MAAVPHTSPNAGRGLTSRGSPVVAPGNSMLASTDLRLLPPLSHGAEAMTEKAESALSKPPFPGSASPRPPLHHNRSGGGHTDPRAKCKDALVTTSLDLLATFTPLAVSCSSQLFSCGFGENIPRLHVQVLTVCQELC